MTLWLLLALGCSPEPVDTSPPGLWSDAELATLRGMRLPDTWADDPSNPSASRESVKALGGILFFDPSMSANSAVSCGSCHKPEHHFTDGLPLAQGIGTAQRHTPTIVGSQQGPWFFWDGRADSLWSQALGPLENPAEMGGDRMSIVRYATETHSHWFEAAWGPAPDLSDRDRFPEHARPAATGEHAWMAREWDRMAPEDQQLVDELFSKVGKSLAAYELGLQPTEAPFDRYVDAVVAGDPAGGGELTEQQVHGLDLFIGKGQCTLCHSGPLFSDRAFHNNGVPETRPGYDPGRRSGAPMVLGSPFNCRGPFSEQERCDELDYLDPSFDDFQAAFKTPTLRYVSETAPYFHNGSHATLEDVVAFYSELPGNPPVGHRELTLKPLNLTDEETDAIVAFLESLTGDPVTP